MVDSEVPQPPFTVAVSHDGGSALVSFSGELDVVSAPNMRQAFLDPEVADASQVRVDLTRVTFFDSSALGVVVAACRRVRDKDGGAFAVTYSDGVVGRILKISGLLDYLQVDHRA